MRRLNRYLIGPIGLIAAIAGCGVRLEAGMTTYTGSASFESAIAGDTTSIEDHGTPANGTSIAEGQTVDGITYAAFTPGPRGDSLSGGIAEADNSFMGESLGGAQSTGATYSHGGDPVTAIFAEPINESVIFFNAHPNSDDYGFTTSVATALIGSASYDSSTFVVAGLVSTDTAFTSVTSKSSDLTDDSSDITEIIAASVPELSVLFLLTLGVARVIYVASRGDQEAAIRSSAQD